MTISNAVFAQAINSYLRDYPEPIDAQTQATLTTLAQRTFKTAEEAKLALEDFVGSVQRSDKPWLKGIVQALFDQKIKRLSSASAAEESSEIRPRHETGNTKIGILDLPLDPLAYIFSFLDNQSQGRVAQVCRDFRGAMRLRRIYDCDSLFGPAFTQLISLFGITPPSPTPSSKEASVAYEALFAKVSYILEGVKTSRALSDEEKKPFRTMSAGKIVQDPSLLKNLLHTAYEIGLVTPFLDRKNAGPELLTSMTLEAKAEAVREHLKEKGDGYTELVCRNSEMLCFPTEFCSLQNLQKLDLCNSFLTIIPTQIGQLAQLQVLDLSVNRLTTIPAEIGQLAQLRELYLEGNRITTMPAEIWQLANLQYLGLSHNRITTMPAEIWRLARLQHLTLGDNQFTTVPDGIWQLSQLQALDLRNNHLITIPAQIGQLAKLRYLRLGGNRITTIPPEIGRLAQLRELYLENNHLATIPPEIGRLAQLVMLGLGRNYLTTIPDEIGRPKWLDLRNNLLTTIPDGIWRCTHYREIHLAGNPLTVIPKSTQNVHISL